MAGVRGTATQGVATGSRRMRARRPSRPSQRRVLCVMRVACSSFLPRGSFRGSGLMSFVSDRVAYAFVRVMRGVGGLAFVLAYRIPIGRAEDHGLGKAYQPREHSRTSLRENARKGLMTHRYLLRGSEERVCTRSSLCLSCRSGARMPSSLRPPPSCSPPTSHPCLQSEIHDLSPRPSLRPPTRPPAPPLSARPRPPPPSPRRRRPPPSRLLLSNRARSPSLPPGRPSSS